MSHVSTTTFAVFLAVPLTAAIVANVSSTSVEWNLCIAGIAAVSLAYGAFVRRGFPGLSSVDASRAGNVARPGSQGRDLAVLLAFIAPTYVAFQLLPLPLPLLRLLSPKRAEITDALGAVMPRPWFAPLSVDPAATAQALMTVMACVLCFLVVRELTGSSLRRASWLTIFPLIEIGLLEGGLALWQAWGGVDVAGTYWNRNHLAGLLEMVLPFSVVYVMNIRRRDRIERSATTAGGMVRSMLVGAVLPMVSIAIIFLGVVASGSKLGYVATLFGLLAMGLVVALTRLTGFVKWLCIAAVPVVGIAAFALLGNQDVLVRIAGVVDSADGMSGEGRLPIWLDTLRLLAAYPVFGSGLGTYSTAFLSFQTAGIGMHWTHAHNDYLELATGLGITGLSVFGALIIVVARRAIRLAPATRQSGSDLAALGCLGAFAAIGLHSVADFNLYVPGNALLLAWIAGIAAGIPLPFDAQAAERVHRAWPQPRHAALAMAVIALGMSSIAVAKGASSSAIGAENAPLTLNERLDAVRKTPAWPYAWLDLADALKTAGRTGEAMASVSNAIAFGPRVRPVVRRSATLFDALGDRRQAVTLMSHELDENSTDPGDVFDWFVERRIPYTDVLAGLSNDPRLLPAYLRYLMLPGTCREAGEAWQALLAHHPEPKLVGEYVSFVSNDCYKPDDAARAWSDYAKQASPGYQVSDWVFNGGFEQDSAPVRFDWQWNQWSREAEATFVDTEKFSGSRSLQMTFRGPSRATYQGPLQEIPVTPGVYRFTAAVRTLGLNSSDGIRFVISSPDMNMRTEQATGTTEWHTLSIDLVIPAGTSQITIQLVRRPGPGAEKEEDLIGTAWVDAITLTRIG